MQLALFTSSCLILFVGHQRQGDGLAPRPPVVADLGDVLAEGPAGRLQVPYEPLPGRLADLRLAHDADDAAPLRDLLRQGPGRSDPLEQVRRRDLVLRLRPAG